MRQYLEAILRQASNEELLILRQQAEKRRQQNLDAHEESVRRQLRPKDPVTSSSFTFPTQQPHIFSYNDDTRFLDKNQSQFEVNSFSSRLLLDLFLKPIRKTETTVAPKIEIQPIFSPPKIQSQQQDFISSPEIPRQFQQVNDLQAQMFDPSPKSIDNQPVLKSLQNTHSNRFPEIPTEKEFIDEEKTKKIENTPPEKVILKGRFHSKYTFIQTIKSCETNECM